MSFHQKDFLQRMLEQLSEMTATLLGRRGKVPPEVLVDELRRGKEDLMGVPLVVLDSLGPTAVRDLLRGEEAMAAYRELLELEAGLLEDAGRADEASVLRGRIETLR